MDPWGGLSTQPRFRGCHEKMTPQCQDQDQLPVMVEEKHAEIMSVRINKWIFTNKFKSIVYLNGSLNLFFYL